MDSGHGPHSHSPSHGSQPSIHLQPSKEGDYDNSPNSPETAPQTIEIPASTGHSSVESAVTTPGYDYQSSPPSTAPAKQSSTPSSSPSASSSSPPSISSRVHQPVLPPSSGSDSLKASQGVGLASDLLGGGERLSSHRFKPPGGSKPRSRSLPATLRKKRKHADNQQHLPPVTLSTLRELDLHEIYRNPKLRHDVVFDAQLHFRPNLDGSRGRRKREQADVYWKLVLHECEKLFVNVRNRQAGAARMALKLPILFMTMRDILLTLVPKSDRGEVEAALDPPLLMQQLEHGVLDFKKLAEWLAGVLKAHCAPMRDQWVEQMVTRVAHGVDNQKTSAFVDGLKMIFGILEAMKLDVANHQIRTLRPHLISTAVHFEQGYFQERIELGRLDMTEPKAWFQTAMNEGQTSDPYVAYTRAATEMLAPTKYCTYPATFQFDFERLDGIRDDMREATCLKLALLFFRQLTLSSKRDMDAATVTTLRAQLLAILSEEDGPYRWIRGCNAVALHMAQAAHEFNGNTGLVGSTMVKVAENWFEKHLRLESPIYIRVERDVVKDITTTVLQIMKSWSSLSTSPIMQAADLTGSSLELASISQRIAHIAFLHWRIFGKLYLS